LESEIEKLNIDPNIGSSKNLQAKHIGFTSELKALL
jgi:hypothetical protein